MKIVFIYRKKYCPTHRYSIRVSLPPLCKFEDHLILITSFNLPLFLIKYNGNTITK
jgi:hypothetical protein